MGVVINEGTQTTVNTSSVGGVQTQVVRLDVGSGTVVSNFGGTVARVTDLLKGTITAVTSVAEVVKGTVTNLATGTLNALAAGTITNGTVLTFGLRHADEFATVVSTGTNVLGTIKAGVSGSQIFVTGLVISAGSATNVEIASGGTSTPIGGTYYFNANGGLALTPIDPPLRTVAGSALVYKQSAAVSPISITCVGYVD